MLFYWQNIQFAIQQMLDSNLDFFVHSGMNIWTALATCLLVWFGMEQVLSEEFDLAGFINLIFVLCVGLVMVRFYSDPIPGLGFGLHKIVTLEAEAVSRKIGVQMIDKMINGLDQFKQGLETPGLTNFVGMVYWAILIVSILLCQTVGAIILAYSQIATSVCILLGPLFVPFFVAPKSLSWIFDGWLRSLIQFSFLKVIVSAVIFVVASAILAILNALPAGMSLAEEIRNTPGLLLVLFGGIYALLKTPSLCNHIFSGASGGGLSGVLTAVAGRISGI